MVGAATFAETKVETTGAPAAVRLVAARSTLDTDGEDIAIVAVSVVDERGRVVPAAANPITFKLEGPGRIIGVGNGAPSSHEPDKFVTAPTLRMRALHDWRWKKVADSYSLDLPELSPGFDDSAWAKADVRSERGPLGIEDRAIFRMALQRLRGTRADHHPNHQSERHRETHRTVEWPFRGNDFPRHACQQPARALALVGTHVPVPH
jgi:hypothetical protein